MRGRPRQWGMPAIEYPRQRFAPWRGFKQCIFMDSVAENRERMDNLDAGTKNRGSGRLKLVIFAVAVAALIVLFMSYDLQDVLTRGLDEVKELGWIGGLVFVLLYIVACLFLLPGSVLTLGAGAIYGLGYGFVPGP